MPIYTWDSCLPSLSCFQVELWNCWVVECVHFMFLWLLLEYCAKWTDPLDMPARPPQVLYYHTFLHLHSYHTCILCVLKDTVYNCLNDGESEQISCFGENSIFSPWSVSLYPLPIFFFFVLFYKNYFVHVGHYFSVSFVFYNTVYLLPMFWLWLCLLFGNFKCWYQIC